MYNLVNLFKPIIAKPKNTTTYVEISPCDLLKPYIKCYWGSPQPVLKLKKEAFMPLSTVIIPDTCMDIIFEIDYYSNKISSIFCGIHDAPFHVFDVNKTTLICIHHIAIRMMVCEEAFNQIIFNFKYSFFDCCFFYKHAFKFSFKIIKVFVDIHKSI